MWQFGLALRSFLRGIVLLSAVATAKGQLLAVAQNYSDLPDYQPSSRTINLAEYRAPLIFISARMRNDSNDMSSRWLSSAPPSKRAKPAVEKMKRATINPSMVGYIDDAIVRSEVRFRFDAAFDDTTPDRAEFFYAKCGCYRAGPDPHSPGPGPGVPKYVNFQQLYFYGEYAPTTRASVFVELPIRWLQPNSNSAFPNASGFGDMHLGIKVAPLVFAHSHVTLQFKALVPSGNASEGLGTNHASIEPSLLYYQQVSDRLAVEAEVGDTHPLSSSAGVPTNSSNGFAGDVFFYGVGPSFQLINAEHTRLDGVLEFVGWNVRSGYVTGPANPSTAGVNITNLKLGPRVTLFDHHSLYLGYGIALTSQKWYREIFRIEYRYAF